MWRWRESLEPKGQANKVEEMQTAKLIAKFVWEMRKLIGRLLPEKRRRLLLLLLPQRTTNFAAQQIGNKFGSTTNNKWPTGKLAAKKCRKKRLASAHFCVKRARERQSGERESLPRIAAEKKTTGNRGLKG